VGQRRFIRGPSESDLPAVVESEALEPDGWRGPRPNRAASGEIELVPGSRSYLAVEGKNGTGGGRKSMGFFAASSRSISGTRFSAAAIHSG
jgi:hypothetical protein